MKYLALFALLVTVQTSHALRNDECDPKNFDTHQVYYEPYTKAVMGENNEVLLPAAWKQMVLDTSPVYSEGKMNSRAKYAYSGICMLNHQGRMVPYRVDRRNYFWKLWTSPHTKSNGIVSRHSIFMKMDVQKAFGQWEYKEAGKYLDGQATNLK